MEGFFFFEVAGFGVKRVQIDGCPCNCDRVTWGDSGVS